MDVNFCDIDGVSLLFIVSQYGYDVIVNLLINYGVDVNNKIKNFKEQSVICYIVVFLWVKYVFINEFLLFF